MSTDRTGGVDGGAEAVEDRQPRDRPPPPPPPDQPGAEPAGVPSRADSRAAAAAPSKPETSPPAEDDAAQPESSTSNESPGESAAPESRNTSSDGLSSSAQEPSGERDIAVELSATDEQPAARDAETEPLDGPGSSAAFDNDTEPRPNTPTTSPVEEMTVGDERAPAQPAATSEAVDIAAPPMAQENADAEEAFPAFDDAGKEAAGLPSRADSHAAAAAANTEVAEKPTVDSAAVTERADVPAPPSKIPTDPTDARASATDQPPSDDAPAVPEIGERTEQDADEDVAVTTERQAQSTEAQVGDTGQDAVDTTAEGKPKGIEFWIGDKTLREHIDPAGAGAGLSDESKEPFEPQGLQGDVPWTAGVDRLDELPTGEELVEPEDDKRSRAERARRKLYESESLETSTTSRVGPVMGYKISSVLRALVAQKPECQRRCTHLSITKGSTRETWQRHC